MSKQFFGTSINESSTINIKSAADVADVRGKAIKFDENGNAVVASTAGEVILGIALITTGDPDGKINTGDGVDIQIKDCGIAISGGTITAGAALAVDANGKLVTATDGDFVIGYALASAETDDFVSIQISKSFKASKA